MDRLNMSEEAEGKFKDLFHDESLDWSWSGMADFLLEAFSEGEIEDFYYLLGQKLYPGEK